MKKISIEGAEYTVPFEIASYIERLERENKQSYKKVLFTPEKAKEVLDKLYENEESRLHNQRGKKAIAVKSYAKDMKNDNWLFCGDSIRFDKDGYCIDGQQRLNAIVESEKPQEFIVVDNLPTEAKLVIDSGFKKTVEDYLKSAEKGYKLGATAIVRQVYTFSKKGKNIGNSSGDKGITYSDVVDIYKSDMDGYNEAAIYGGEISKKTKKLKKTEVGSIYYYLLYTQGVDEINIRNFFQQVAGADIDSDSFYGRIGRTLIQKDCKGATRTDLLIRAWNYFYLKLRLKITNEEWKNTFQDKFDWFVNDETIKEIKAKALPKEELETALSAQK